MDFLHFKDLILCQTADYKGLINNHLDLCLHKLILKQAVNPYKMAYLRTIFHKDHK